MNVYLINLGHARPELERSISFFFYGDVKRLGEYQNFDKLVNNVATKEGRDYFVKSVVKNPFPIRKIET